MMLVKNLIFLHAILGSLKEVCQLVMLQQFSTSVPSTVHNVVAAGENTMVSLYGGKPGGKLDGMRYQGYCTASESVSVDEFN